MRRFLLLPFLLLLAGSAVLVACSDDDADTEAASHEAATDVGAVLAALNILNGAGFHHIDEVLVQEGGEIEAGWVGAVRNARTATAVVEWPESLHELVEAFLTESNHLLDALIEDDQAAAAEASTPAHGAFHSLTGAGFSFLAEQVGMEGGDDHDADSDDHD
ncbi:MAG TPA: hypothetical protein QF624_06050 [Dehalococcoidia bacterium]|nr:hypothetical protein [Dehalococcoidia bacterium]